MFVDLFHPGSYIIPMIYHKHAALLSIIPAQDCQTRNIYIILPENKNEMVRSSREMHFKISFSEFPKPNRGENRQLLSIFIMAFATCKIPLRNIRSVIKQVYFALPLSFRIRPN